MLGPPGCDDCNVWLILYPPNTKRQKWICPVCGGDGGTAYKWLYSGKPMYSDDMVPFLRFLKGKSPQDTK